MVIGGRKTWILMKSEPQEKLGQWEWRQFSDLHMCVYLMAAVKRRSKDEAKKYK